MNEIINAIMVSIAILFAIIITILILSKLKTPKEQKKISRIIEITNNKHDRITYKRDRNYSPQEELREWMLSSILNQLYSKREYGAFDSGVSQSISIMADAVPCIMIGQISRRNNISKEKLEKQFNDILKEINEEYKAKYEN